jgi:hypothetical protein
MSSDWCMVVPKNVVNVMEKYIHKILLAPLKYVVTLLLLSLASACLYNLAVRDIKYDKFRLYP